MPQNCLVLCLSCAHYRLGSEGGTKSLTLYTTPSAVKGLILSGLLIGFNWFIYIWELGVNSGRVVETSLGYYMNPRQ